MKILLTAAGGFVGQHLIKILIEREFEVFGLYRSQLPTLTASLLNKASCRLVEVDLTRPLAIDFQPDVIIHNAADILGKDSPALDYVNSNILATKHVIDFAVSRKTPKLIFFSSMSVFGTVQDTLVTENTIICNPGAYGASKLYGEIMLAEVENQMSSLSMRLPGIVGEGSEGTWLGGIVEKALRNSQINIHNAQNMFNNVVHVEDVCQFIIKSLDKISGGAKIITLGTPDALTIRDVVKTIIKNLKSSSIIIDKGERSGSFTIGTSKAVSEYGFSSKRLDDILSLLTEIKDKRNFSR